MKDQYYFTMDNTLGGWKQFGPFDSAMDRDNWVADNVSLKDNPTGKGILLQQWSARSGLLTRSANSAYIKGLRKPFDKGDMVWVDVRATHKLRLKVFAYQNESQSEVERRVLRMTEQEIQDLAPKGRMKLERVEVSNFKRKESKWI